MLKECETCETTELEAVIVKIPDLFTMRELCETCHDKLPEPSFTQPD